MCALSLLCPVLNPNRITCSVLFSLRRLTGCSLGVAASIFFLKSVVMMVYLSSFPAGVFEVDQILYGLQWNETRDTIMY